jgi:hypothetical protein
MTGVELTEASRVEYQKKLEAFLLNKHLVAKVTFPASKNGIDVKTDGTWDQRWATRNIKEHGVGIDIGETAAVTAVYLRPKHIEIHLNGGGAGTFGDSFWTGSSKMESRARSGGKVAGGSRINLKFDRPITEEDIRDLGRLASYLEPVVDTSSLHQDIAKQNLPEEFKAAAAKGEIVVGMDKQTVFAILGEPKNKTVNVSADPPLEKWQYELRDLKTRVVTFKEGKVAKVTDF